MDVVTVTPAPDLQETLSQESPQLAPQITVGEIASRAPSMEAVSALIQRAATVQTTVLIGGESGTGKDVAARTIHDYSPRKSCPFVAMNCAAIPDALAEAEMFGFEKGAFTGATGARIGQFQAAEGGTLFIDEIGDLPLALQAKFLRVLETRVVTPLGGHREIPIDVRIIAATNRNLEEMVARQLFREDLFYRLNVIAISLPPLRERMEDIEDMVHQFLKRVNARNGTHITEVAPAAWEQLRHYPWPGNIRELLNVIERGVVLCGGTVLEVGDISPSVGSNKNPKPAPQGSAFVLPCNRDSGGFPTLKNLEQEAISSAMIVFTNNRTRAARALGISVRTLQRKLKTKKLNFDPAFHRSSGYLSRVG